MASEKKPGAKSTILVVEDESLLLMVVSEILREAGYNVLEAGNGETALTLLADSPEVHLLMTDIRMPGINGYQLVQRSLELRPDLRVVMMTGYAQETVPGQIAALDIPILRKPFDFAKLPALASSVLSR